MGYNFKLRGVQSSMIGASHCCHVTLLILLLVLRLTIANIITPNISSSSSLSSSAFPFAQSSLQSALPTSSSAKSGRTSPKATNSPSSFRKSKIIPHIPLEAQSSVFTNQTTATSISSTQSPHRDNLSSLSMQITPHQQDHAQDTARTNSLSPRLRNRFHERATDKDKAMLQGIETLLLKSFGLQRRPKITNEYAVPEYMLDLYRSQQKRRSKRSTHVKIKGTGAIAANTVRSFVHTDADGSSSCQPPRCSRIHFDITSIPESETLAGSELRIFVASTEEPKTETLNQVNGAVEIAQASTSKDRVKIEVHEIMSLSSTSGDTISRLLDTQVIRSETGPNWLSFDIRPAVLRWKRKFSDNNGLEIRLVTNSSTISMAKHIRVRRSAHLERDWSLQRPLLVAYTNDGSSPMPESSTSFTSKLLKRRKRQTSDKKTKKNKKNKANKRRRKKKGNKNICNRHALYVNFYDVGWDDWIVAPPGYNAFYCHGDCMAPLPHFTKASNHAMLQARYYTVNPGAVPMVCCVPSKMTGISMLYRDEKGHTVLKHYQDMSVVECSCT